MQNVYKSSYYKDARAEEFDRASVKWNQSQSPFETGVVPKPAYANMFANPLADMNAQAGQAPSQIRSTLSGKVMTPEQFAHNNMQPYIRGSVTQNTDTFANSSILENRTGRGDLYMHKKEQECLFEPTSQYGNACGFMSSPIEYERSHMQEPIARRNDFPIEQIHVGPGLGLGYTANPAGGFHQANTIDIVRPKNVDELRVATNPRVTYELPPQGPKGGISQRGIIGSVAKNKPDTYFQQSPDMWLKTRGAFTKETGRPEQEMKPTSRVDTHIDYEGPAQSSSSHPGIGTSDDYGLDSVMVYNNNRQDTGQHTILNNLTSTVKAVIAPLLDFFRHTPKEYTLDASRVFGNMQAQIPEKATLYDPVTHMMKTTIKETTIHDTTVANLKGAERVTAANMDDAKATIRQTTPLVDTTRQMSAHTYRVQVYNVDEISRTTVRETTKESVAMYGFVGGNITDTVGAYTVIDVDMKNTQKQYTSDYEYEGIAGSKSDFRAKSEEAERNAVIDPTRDMLNKEAGHTPGGGGAYTGLAPENVDMESKRLVSDSLAGRKVGNVTRITQPTGVAIGECATTKIGNNYVNANVDRLDVSTLNALRTNPYNLSINPIGN